MMLRMEEILRMEMIHALSSKVRDGMDSSNGMILNEGNYKFSKKLKVIMLNYLLHCALSA
ncbi:hypothetical protein KAX97_07555 [candidate division WOR-3 bacterium]|nr:hypothetical protein [candidate division WOR-3 bacterium]